MFRNDGFEILTLFETTKFQYSKFKKIQSFLPHSCSNVSQILGYHGFDSILMTTLISSKKLGECNNMRHPVVTQSGHSFQNTVIFLVPKVSVVRGPIVIDFMNFMTNHLSRLSQFL